MKIRVVASVILVFGAVSFMGCREEVRGVCKCKYLSGDKVEFDYSDLTVDHAKAKCDSTSANAEAFAGDCHLE